jgi:4a-hydroxytetrahydrobiopterin dehydratase
MATPALSQEEISAALAELNDWKQEGDTITKTLMMPTYMAGLAFAAAVGTVAEGLDHHPDLLITWRKVRISFTTHDAGHKISHKDIQAAKAVDALGYPRI